MECNRDEAIRAKGIAEKKLADKDFTGAKKFTLKAQTLYPELDGISHMLNTLDVYICYEKKVNGESDWYGVLGVNPSDDDETIRKQYRKLVLILHPDKNKSVGADGAFKILSEAWGLLSDKAKRSVYNQKLNSRVFQQNVSPPCVRRSPARGANGFHPCTNRATSKPNVGPVEIPPAVVAKAQAQAQVRAQAKAQAQAKVQAKVQAKTQAKAQFQAKARNQAWDQAKAQAHARVQAPPPLARGNKTFWTTCDGCSMHHEYVKLYLNHTILCPTCHKPFLAKEVPDPTPGPGLSTNNNTGHSRKKVHGNVDPSFAASIVREATNLLKRGSEEIREQWASKKRKGENAG
ncbi:DnaJ domain-containing protein [Artemisia annua]|uniref:DnaJ domain-containing protein n=1 Tax=Artemisia annua TaxID=35608 RepID=A0A2U1PWQ8_ARTAN|nr:DnaJ domain-containing protein [Artemisia annua]